MKKLVVAASAALFACSLTASSFGGLLVDWKQDPSNNMPELIYNNTPELLAGSGSIGNSSFAIAGGLRIESPYDVQAANPASPLFTNLAYAGAYDYNATANTTAFLDVTMVLSGLTALGDVQPYTVGLKSFIYQDLAPGTFKLISYYPGGDPSLGITLLGGTIHDASISGPLGSSNGAVFASTVDYTEGLILNAIGGGTQKGDLSWSLLEVKPGLKADITGKILQAFTADATGLFSVIPEPTSLGLVAMAGCSMILRRRRTAK